MDVLPIQSCRGRLSFLKISCRDPLPDFAAMRSSRLIRRLKLGQTVSNTVW